MSRGRPWQVKPEICFDLMDQTEMSLGFARKLAQPARAAYRRIWLGRI